jgi:uncharacterized protein YcbK (DUF882 family)
MKIAMQITTNFNLSEFQSKDGALMPDNVRDNIIRLARALQLIRNEVGRPITITSGYRSPEHNRRVRGAANSQHLLGTAADFQVAQMTPAQVVQVIERMISEGRIPQGGLKAYKTWVHYDIAGTRRRW